jgi:hypothetical protein
MMNNKRTDAFPNTESRTRLMTALVQELHEDGVPMATVLALVEEASEIGAGKALAACGLHDDKAGDDVKELRSLLDAWRFARHTAWHTTIKWVTTIIIVLVMAGAAVKFKAFEL